MKRALTGVHASPRVCAYIRVALELYLLHLELSSCFPQFALRLAHRLQINDGVKEKRSGNAEKEGGEGVCEKCAVTEMRSASWENRATQRLGCILSKESDDVFQCDDIRRHL